MTFAIAAVLVAFASSSCGNSAAQGSDAVRPRYPNVFGTAVAEQPDNGGDFFAPRHGEVTLTLSDGRRLVVPSSVETPGARAPIESSCRLERARSSLSGLAAASTT